MKLKVIDLLLILLGIIIAYQIVKKILGGSWQTEGVIIALLIFNLGLLWKLNTEFLKLNFKFNGPIKWHKQGGS